MTSLFKHTGAFGRAMAKLGPLPVRQQSNPLDHYKLELARDLGVQLKPLVDFAPFRAFTDQLKIREQLLLSALRSAPLRDVAQIQAQLKELGAVLQCVPDAIAQGDAASKQLDERSA